MQIVGGIDQDHPALTVDGYRIGKIESTKENLLAGRITVVRKESVVCLHLSLTTCLRGKIGFNRGVQTSRPFQISSS